MEEVRYWDTWRKSLRGARSSEAGDVSGDVDDVNAERGCVIREGRFVEWVVTSRTKVVTSRTRVVTSAVKVVASSLSLVMSSRLEEE